MNAQPQFSNFDLQIAKADEGCYSVSVLQSPAGETLEPVLLSIPYQEDPVRQWLQQLAEDSITGDDLVSLGRHLSRYLFPAGRLRDLYYRSLGMVAPTQSGLRLRLHILAPEVATLPWEYIYDEDIEEFFVLNPRTSLVRYHHVPVPPLPITSYAPVPILAVLSNPPGTRPLATEQTLRTLLDSLTGLISRRQVQIDVLYAGSAHERKVIENLVNTYAEVHLLAESATLNGLRNALRQPYRILHVVGHGGFDETIGGALYLADEQGEASLTTWNLLAQTLRASSVASVILNACHSAVEGTARAFIGLAPSLIRAGIPAVVAMQYAIREDSAACFSAALYRALADGWTLDAAVTEGRKAVRAAVSEDDIDWGIPVLFMRSPDGLIWQTTQNAKVDAGRSKVEEIANKNRQEANPPSQATTVIGGAEAHIEIAGDLVLGSKTQITSSTVYLNQKQKEE